MQFLSVIARCKDEPFVLEFVEHYIREGVDMIYIVDDNSSLPYNKEVLKNGKVKIFFEKDIIENETVDEIYDKIKDQTEWLIYVDIDEFITTKKENTKRIRDILIDTFSEVDCIKVPWVMMSANAKEKNPKSLLEEITWRWNHDKRHVSRGKLVHKFRCRYDCIEIKSIFKPLQFEKIWDHHPKKPLSEVTIIESIYGTPSLLSPFYENLREKDISDAHLVCYHYRVISIENSKNKIKNNIWYNDYRLEDLMSTDYAEVYDDTLKKKSLLSKKKLED